MDPIAPMEALLAEALPDGPGWQYEPKWDGFRCIAIRDGGKVALWSKSGKPLGRYFPEVETMFGRLKAKRFVIDGELLILSRGVMAFDALQLRLHPAASRVAKLSAETPALLMAFDCLELSNQKLADKPLSERRVVLEGMLEKESEPALWLSPATANREE